MLCPYKYYYIFMIELYYITNTDGTADIAFIFFHSPHLLIIQQQTSPPTQKKLNIQYWPVLLLCKHVNLYHFKIVLQKQELVSNNPCPYRRNAKVAGVFIETSVGQQRDSEVMVVVVDGCLQSIYSHLRLLLIFI